MSASADSTVLCRDDDVGDGGTGGPEEPVDTAMAGRPTVRRSVTTAHRLVSVIDTTLYQVTVTDISVVRRLRTRCS